jgi:eukaryotic translation initiation factor 2C
MEEREMDAWQKITNKRADIDEPQDDPNVDYPLRLDKRETTKKAVETNHFELKFDDQVQFYEYEITGFPVGINRTVRRKYFRDAVATIPWLHLGRSHYGTDGLKTIVAWKNIHQNVATRLTASGDASTTFGPFDIPDGKKQLSKTPDENGSFNLYQPMRPVNVKLVRKFGIASLRSYVQGQVSPPTLWTSNAEAKALNIVMASCFDITRVFQHNASRFFVRNTRKFLGNGTSLATLQGFFYTIKPTIGGIMLNVSFATSAFYEPILVSDFIRDENTFPNPAKRLEALVGVRVLIKYPRGKTKEERQADWDYEEGRIKTIQGIGPLSIRSQKFKVSKDASPISVDQYLIHSECFKALSLTTTNNRSLWPSVSGT